MKLTADTTIRLHASIEEAYTVKVTVKGLEAYKDAFLIISNNVRSWPQLLKVEQNDGNDIYVTCKPSAVKDTQEWLEQFGDVYEPRKVLIAVVSEDDLCNYDWSLDDYDDVKIVEK